MIIGITIILIIITIVVDIAITITIVAFIVIIISIDAFIVSSINITTVYYNVNVLSFTSTSLSSMSSLCR